VTLYPPKLSNCGNLTYLAYLFPKCPQHIFLKKKKSKKQKMGWLATTTPTYIYIYFWFFFDFFLEKKKKVLGAFWE
jgi:hypothetical protein